MAHQITSESGGNLGPAVHGVVVAEGGASLGPAAGFALVAESGGNLGPAVHGVVVAEGGASLGPAAGFALVAEGQGNLGPAVHGGIRAENTYGAVTISGTLTKNGSTPLVFPTLLRAAELTNGRPLWSSSGEPLDALGAGDYVLYYQADNFVWALEFWEDPGVTIYGWDGGTTEMSPFEVETWSNYTTETGTPVLGMDGTAAPAQLTPESGF